MPSGLYFGNSDNTSIWYSGGSDFTIKMDNGSGESETVYSDVTYTTNNQPVVTGTWSINSTSQPTFINCTFESEKRSAKIKKPVKHLTRFDILDI
tara:strand:+ start:40913 stop:41197 length:285 start_codon:yes stop_codon:yes gene_type:complete